MIQLIKRQLKIDWWGHHGIRHWTRVRRNGRIIAQHVPGINTTVTDLFAVLHDAGRVDEHDDPEHGWRCAVRLRRLHKPGEFGLSTSQYTELLFAIEHHSEQIKPISPTVAACWNADRLDIGRVGLAPSKRFMCPEALPPDHIIEQLAAASQREHGKLRRLHANLLSPRDVGLH